MRIFPAAAVSVVLSFGVQAEDYLVHSWKKQQLSNEFWSEGANFGDFNKDGENDIVSGPFWWEGPDFKKRYEYAPATLKFERKNADGSPESAQGVDPHGYSKNFFAFTHDFNKDGWTDILILGFPGEESWWFENPKGGSGHWTRHVAIEVTDNESPTFGDITGDGKPEIICSSKGFYGYATPDEKNPAELFTWHPITPDGKYHKFTHGLGYGDVNGDGRMDLLEKDGWWEQPASLDGDPVWKRHPFQFSEKGGAHMYAYDFDGDGDNDVLTSVYAHGFGLVWWENIKKGEKITFERHSIMGSTPEENKYGVKFSQLHAIDLVDMNGDGIKDIVTGKRWWAHGPTGDDEPNAAAVVYWFEVKRGPQGPEFIPHQIDDDSGVGTQVVAGNVNKDQWPDVVIGNKKGTYVLLHQVKKGSKADYEKAQPKPVAAR